MTVARRCKELNHWCEGWWGAARHQPSPNFGPRPPLTAVTLAVVHSISLPPGHYGGAAIERFFTNQLDCERHPYFQTLKGLQVSAHFLVRRNGDVVQFVSCDQRAWHAGASQWRGQTNCNDFSIGIELEGLEGERFRAAQYRALERLLRAACWAYPTLRDAAGHEHVAPGRKGDPGAGFHWRRLSRRLSGLPLQVSLP
jgi:N-acetyl-anhydromuramoyl-L-alanine amidase